MAERYAVGNGDWSDTGTWNGGTLPGASDTVHCNNFTVAIDQDITVTEITTSAGSTAVSGGGCTLSGSGDRAINAILRGGVGNVVRVTGWSSGGTLTITGDVFGGSGSSRAIWGTGGVYNLVITGDITGGTGNTTPAVEITSGITSLVVNGDVFGGSDPISYGIKVGTDSVTINGDVTGGGSQSGSQGMILTQVSGTTCVVTGSAIAGTSRYTAAIRNEGNTTCVVGHIVYSQDASNAAAVNPPLDGRCFRIAAGGTITMRDSDGIDQTFTSGGGGGIQIARGMNGGMR